MFDLHGYFPMILEGMTLTIEVALLSLLIAVILGLFGAIAKLSKSRIARSVATVYTTLIRGIPDLVLMTIIFYGVKSKSTILETPWAGITSTSALLLPEP